MSQGEAEKLFEQGNRLYEQGRYQEAVESYDKALAIDPKYAAAWNNRGLALDNLGKHQEAVESYDKALALDPKLAPAWYNRGNALDNLGKYQEAAEALRRALRLDPNFQEARRALEHLEAGHPVWWWEWWFGESLIKRVVGVVLMGLLGLYLLLPLIRENAVLPGGIALNVGKSFHYYLVPVAAIILLLLLPNIRGIGQRGIELAPLGPREEPRLAPLESREAPEAPASSQGETR